MNRAANDPRPFLVTLGLDPVSFERLDALRERYFPPERNIVPAHLSLFHHLPSDSEASVVRTLQEIASGSPPTPLRFGTLFRMGRGFAVRVDAPQFGQIQAQLVRAFAAVLTDQDRQPFRPHVTLMNKADRDEVARGWADAGATWSPWDGIGVSFLLWRYAGGPWEPVCQYPFLATPESSTRP